MKIVGQRNSNGIYEIKKKDLTGNLVEFNFPSVTTILSILKDDELEDLKNSMSDEQFQIISERGANRGTIMHAFLENYTKAYKKFKDPEKSLLYSQQKTEKQFQNNEFNTDDPELYKKGMSLFYNMYYSDFIKEMSNPLLIEGLMVNFIDEYAGRTDIIYENRFKKIVVGDFKSSSKMLYANSNKVQKYFIQASAYCVAFEQMYNKSVDEAVIWVSYPNGTQHFSLTKFMIPIYYNYFLKLIDEYKKSLTFMA